MKWPGVNSPSVWFTGLHKSWGRLLIWQLSRRQSLTPFTRRVSHKHSLPKKLAVHRVLYPSMLTEVEWKEKVWKKKNAQPTDRTAALWGLSSKIDSRIWVNLTRNGLRLGSRHQEPPHTDVFKEFGYSCRIPLVKPLLNHRQRQRRLTWAKEKKNWLVAQWSKVLFQMRASFVFHLETKVPRVWRNGGEAHSPSCMKSSVKFPQSVMIWVQCHLLVLVHCVFWKPTSLHPFTKKFWSTSCFLLLTSFLKMLISFSSRIWHLPHCQKHQKLVKWPWCWCAWLGHQTHQTWTP